MKTFELSDVEVIELPEWQINKSKSRLKQHKFLFTPGSNALALQGFLDYLCFCYQQHFAACMSPSDIMYMVQSEIALTVKKFPNTYSSLFTTTPGEKQKVIVLAEDPEVINVDSVINALKDRVPTKVDMFLPEFSTDTPVSRLSSRIAFCDMVSPYYNYGMLLCGIPRIEIAGTAEDWDKLYATLADLWNLFSGSLKDYLNRVLGIVSNIIQECKTGNGDYFKKMVSMKPCGSGSDYEVTGWICGFMNIKNCDRAVMLKNLHQHISRMEYKNLDTGKEFELKAGIFYAFLDGDTALPVYNVSHVELVNKEPRKEVVTL